MKSSQKQSKLLALTALELVKTRKVASVLPEFDVRDGTLWLARPTGDVPLGSVKGDTGDTGPQGDPGDAGSQGDSGEIGAKGDSGSVGDAGPQGAAGDVGVKGNTGPQGAAGDAGPQGAAGDIGPQGETGETGPQGNTGLQGKQGRSVEDVFFKNNKLFVKIEGFKPKELFHLLIDSGGGSGNRERRPLHVNIDTSQPLTGNMDVVFVSGSGVSLEMPTKAGYVRPMIIKNTGLFNVGLTTPGDERIEKQPNADLPAGDSYVMGFDGVDWWVIG